MKFIYLFFIITLFVYGQPEGRYEMRNSKKLTMFFPKDDFNYVDDLLEKNDAESYFELAYIYIKKGEGERAKYYLDLYLKKENDPKKLLAYYNFKKDYVKIEEFLDRIIENEEEATALKYKKKIYSEILKKNLPISKEKYQVGKIEELFSYLVEDDRFREFFNSNKWTKSDVEDIVEKLKRSNLEENSASKKLFNIFASKQERLQNIYYNIKGLGDTKGYFDYFDFARMESLTPEIKTPFEELIYLKYEKNEYKYNKSVEKIKKSALENGDNRSLYSLWTVTRDMEILNYLKSKGEEYNYRYLRVLVEKGDDQLFYSEAAEFVDTYPDSAKREKILEELFTVADGSQKSELLERYRGINGSRVLARERILAAEGPYKMELMESEILKGNKDYTESFIKSLEELYTEEEAEARLSAMETREPYAVYLLRKGMGIPREYRGAAAGYLYRKGNLEELYIYRKYISKDELEVSSQKDARYREEFAKRYPLAEGNIDFSKEKYLYFSDDPKLDGAKVKDIENQRFMEPHEMYYAALYYNKKGDYLKSYRLTDSLNKRYSFAEKIVRLHSENIREIRKLDIKKKDD